MTNKVHAEIEYTNAEGQDVHSDVCPSECKFKNLDKEHREYLHTLLDEWINKSNGTGGFYIKSNKHKFCDDME